mmetsp:Transcript_20979/g.35190  ORF Transcript_20979/g.35190 Transcript_20979/m.35190 type:complete len:365 (+) Transcript_20979:86-1180(+)|eukprot:CAMPEP_0198205290 /NCGR_PEP_ID=MMETSP1445-20131203/8815_1 /TAXON_ID=36898 /ORGANISM="Pyramimonas sp., Strain CCMP2087" /LENGTH=364 /DNA_ID=CAMNT_0043877547 /DNA_START=72 /DNA_END=1166 /DNA_ORIENTATION=-
MALQLHASSILLKDDMRAPSRRTKQRSYLQTVSKAVLPPWVNASFRKSATGGGSVVAPRYIRGNSAHPGKAKSFRVSASAYVSMSGLQSSGYVVSEADIKFFKENGYVHLPGVLSSEEVASFIEPVYEQFMTGELKPEGKDLCDMSGATDRTPEQYTVFNAMLPRRYHPAWQGNLYEGRCQSIADQLQQGDMTIDYDQILAKRPNSGDAVFAWHQDLAYWPPFTEETATATCWLALDDSTRANGCMRFVRGSHTEKELRAHAPVKIAKSRRDDESSHALVTEVDEEKEDVHYVEIKRGDITVHDERVVHGSGPNLSDGWRRAYVLAFRKQSTVAEERRHGFTHSHNDTFSWDEFHKWTLANKEK